MKETYIFKFEFPEFVLGKRHVGREGDTELFPHTERVM